MSAAAKGVAHAKRSAVRRRTPRRPVVTVPPGEFRVPPSLAGPKQVFLCCHYCGYSPPDDLPPGGMCPKCGGHSWERFALSRRLLPGACR